MSWPHREIHTYWLGQCFNVVELLLFTCIFYLWRTSKRNGFLILGGFLIYFFIWTIGKFSFEQFTGWDNYSPADFSTHSNRFWRMDIAENNERDKYCFERRYSFLGFIRNSFICSSHILLFRIIYTNVDVKPKIAQSNLALK